MQLIGDLRKQVEQEGTREGRRQAIKKAGMLLTDEELDRISGGNGEEQYDVPINIGDYVEKWCGPCGRYTQMRYLGNFGYYCTGGCDCIYYFG